MMVGQSAARPVGHLTNFQTKNLFEPSGGMIYQYTPCLDTKGQGHEMDLGNQEKQNNKVLVGRDWPEFCFWQPATSP